MHNEVSNLYSTLYSDDITNRIAELCSLEEISEEDQQELNSLLSLEAQAKSYNCDYDYGETLINEAYFVNYAIELASEISNNTYEETWPYTCIDWEKAAEELKHDYAPVDYNGVTFWIRCT